MSRARLEGLTLAISPLTHAVYAGFPDKEGLGLDPRIDVTIAFARIHASLIKSATDRQLNDYGLQRIAVGSGKIWVDQEEWRLVNACLSTRRAIDRCENVDQDVKLHQRMARLEARLDVLRARPTTTEGEKP